MGKFDGVLICSDFDGTIFNGNEVPALAREAIVEFMSEGGKFCVCSGRGPEFLRDMAHFIRGNTYSICHGGAIITDIWSGETLKDEFVGDEAFLVLEDILNSDAKTVRINIMREDGVIDRYTPEEYLKIKDSISHDAYKITLNGETDEDGMLYVKYAKEHKNPRYSLVRSFSSYIEILKNKNTKGAGARLLKEKLNCKLLVAMGDYENDFALFESADVSFAVANAIPELKKMATHTLTRTVHECAVIEAIDYIEKHYL